MLNDDQLNLLIDLIDKEIKHVESNKNITDSEAQDVIIFLNQTKIELIKSQDEIQEYLELCRKYRVFSQESPA